jgi:hypothetical protein
LLRGAENTLRRFRPAMLIELSKEHLARAGDRIEAAFAFLVTRGYAACELTPEGELLPVDAPRDGDFWFISSDLAKAVTAGRRHAEPTIERREIEARRRIV